MTILNEQETKLTETGAEGEKPYNDDALMKAKVDIMNPYTQISNFIQE